MTGQDDQLCKKVDKCMYDAVIKTGAGLFLGSLTSLLFLRRRTWPIIMGTGFGLGYAYSNCQNDINKSFVLVKQTSKVQ